MSQWWYTNPQPNQLGLSSLLPAAAPILADAQHPARELQVGHRPRDGAPEHGHRHRRRAVPHATDAATLTWTGRRHDGRDRGHRRREPDLRQPERRSRPRWPRWAPRPRRTSPRPRPRCSPRKAANTQDQALIDNLSTVVGAYTLAKPRKNARLQRLGHRDTTPNTLAGGQAAVHALDVLLRRAAGRRPSRRRTVTADAVKAPAAATITVKIANEYGRKPAGNVYAGRQAGRRDGRRAVGRGRQRRGHLLARGAWRPARTTTRSPTRVTTSSSPSRTGHADRQPGRRAGRS